MTSVIYYYLIATCTVPPKQQPKQGNKKPIKPKKRPNDDVMSKADAEAMANRAAAKAVQAYAALEAKRRREELAVSITCLAFYMLLLTCYLLVLSF